MSAMRLGHKAIEIVLVKITGRDYQSSHRGTADTDVTEPNGKTLTRANTPSASQGEEQWS